MKKPLLVLSILSAPLFILAVSLTEIHKNTWDDDVRRLCATDGDARVYEVVYLSEKDHKNLSRLVGSKEETSLYYIETPSVFYLGDFPRLSAYRIQIIRRADEKVIAERKVYERTGGDFVSFIKKTYYSCNDLYNSEKELLEQTFLLKNNDVNFK